MLAIVPSMMIRWRCLVVADGLLYFTDPPFGNMRFSTGDNRFFDAFNNYTQDVLGVYTLTNPDQEGTPELTRLLDYGTPDPAAWYAPNGVAMTSNGDVAIAVTDFADTRFDLYKSDGTGGLEGTPIRLESEYRIQVNNSGFPALNDGLTYSPELDVLFGSGPGGIYVYEASDPYELLGFVRIDDLNANNVLGGGYLWVTANQRVLRIPLAVDATETPTLAPTEAPASAQETSSATMAARKAAILTSALISSVVATVVVG